MRFSFRIVSLEYRIYKTATPPLGKAYWRDITYLIPVICLCHDFRRLVFFNVIFYTGSSFQCLTRNLLPPRSVFSFQASKSRNRISYISSIAKLGYTLLSLFLIHACVFGRYVRVLNSSAVLYRNLCVSTTENYIKDISGSY